MKKLINLTQRQILCIQKDANKMEISFTEMLRRILDDYYGNKINDVVIPPTFLHVYDSSSCN